MAFTEGGQGGGTTVAGGVAGAIPRGDGSAFGTMADEASSILETQQVETLVGLMQAALEQGLTDPKQIYQMLLENLCPNGTTEEFTAAVVYPDFAAVAAGKVFPGPEGKLILKAFETALEGLRMKAKGQGEPDTDFFTTTLKSKL